jgi:hypothetical protein
MKVGMDIFVKRIYSHTDNHTGLDANQCVCAGSRKIHKALNPSGNVRFFIFLRLKFTEFHPAKKPRTWQKQVKIAGCFKFCAAEMLRKPSLILGYHTMLPSLRRGFDSLHPLQNHRESARNGAFFHWHPGPSEPAPPRRITE